MGSISFQVVGDGSVGTKSKTYTVADADINRLVSAWQTRITSPDLPSPTVAQALLAWADRIMTVTKGDVRLTEQQVADAGINDISAS